MIICKHVGYANRIMLCYATGLFADGISIQAASDVFFRGRRLKEWSSLGKHSSSLRIKALQPMLGSCTVSSFARMSPRTPPRAHATVGCELLQMYWAVTDVKASAVLV